MAITLGKQRFNPLAKEGGAAPLQIMFPGTNGTACAIGAAAIITSGKAANGNTADGSTGSFLGFFEETVSASLVDATPVKVSIAVPGTFWVGTLAGVFAAGDIPCTTATSGYAFAADGTVGFAVIDRATAAATGIVRAIASPGRGDLGSAVIRGNIIERAGTTYGTGQTLNTNTYSNWGTIGDTNCRLICTFTPVGSVFGG